MRCPGSSLVVLVCVLLGSLGSAGAQEKSGKQKQADQLFEQGRKLLNEAGNDRAKVKVACDKFDEAIKLDPEAPGTLLNLGLCNEKLDRYKKALYWFRKAQARASETNLPEYEAAAKQHTADLVLKVATVKITFSAPPPGDTKVKIDGEEVAAADYLHAEVDPGHHTLVAGATGKKIVTQEFDVTGRGGQAINIEFVEGENTIIVDRGKGRRTFAIYTAIGGGVLMVAAGGLSWYALAKYNDCVGDNKMIDPDKIKETGSCPKKTIPDATTYANHYHNLARYWATSIFAVGTVTVGIAAYLYFTASEKERVDQTVFIPTIDRDGVGFAFSRAF